MSGLLSSCTRLAAIWPRVASFSACTRCACSCRVAASRCTRAACSRACSSPPRKSSAARARSWSTGAVPSPMASSSPARWSVVSAASGRAACARAPPRGRGASPSAVEARRPPCRRRTLDDRALAPEARAQLVSGSARGDGLEHRAQHRLFSLLHRQLARGDEEPIEPSRGQIGEHDAAARAERLVGDDDTGVAGSLLRLPGPGLVIIGGSGAGSASAGGRDECSPRAGG